jgi:hypothetical protein
MDSYAAYAQIDDGRVLVFSNDVGPLLTERPESPALFDAYSYEADCYLIDGTPTGQTRTHYMLFNGAGWAAITGLGEWVTCHA